MRQGKASEARGGWGEVLLGGVAALGAPVVVRGLGRTLHAPGAEGWAAGVLGALVGCGLAWRQRKAEQRAGRQASVHLLYPPEDEAGLSPGQSRGPPRAPRRGPSGRERAWS